MSGGNFLNAVVILNVADRLAPFILISYFVAHALFQGDARGIIFLGMMLMNCAATAATGNYLGVFLEPIGKLDLPDNHSKCEQINLSSNGPLSKHLPLSVNIFGFTLGYIGQMFQQGDDDSLGPRSYPIVIVLFLYIIYQIWWLYIYGCKGPLNLCLAAALGGFFGYSSAATLYKNGYSELQMFSNISGQDVCKLDSNVEFSCSDSP